MNNINKYLFKAAVSVTRLNVVRVSSLTELCRSVMYVPGDKERMITKVTTLKGASAPDVITFDVEDSVAFSKKALARENILRFFKSGDLGKCARSTICIRFNSVTTPSITLDDISLLSECLKVSNYNFPQMVSLPKVDNDRDVCWLDEQIKSKIQLEKLVQPLKLSIMIESVQGLIKLKDLLHHFTTEKLSCLRLSNVIFGSDDYCATLGTSRSQSNDEVLYARQYVSNIAGAYQIPAIDMVETDLNDIDYFEKNCLFGARIGFVGKQIIHPKQIDSVHSAFSPTLDKVAWANDLLKDFQKHNEAGQGTFVFRNHMIDLPTIKQAQKIVAMSDLIKKKG